jgi:competence protein ComFC
LKPSIGSRTCVGGFKRRLGRRAWLGVASVASGILEILMPRSCALCGASPLESRDPGPLCGRCSESLVPWRGERCRACGLPLISEEGLCMRCRDVEWSFDYAYPLFSYEGKIRDLISAYKKRCRRSLAGPISRILEAEISRLWPGRTIVPVPPRPGKIRSKGWDQVEEIARRLESRGLIVARPLRRTACSEQKRLGRKGRAANALTAYSLLPGRASPDEPLLLDDVITTGATVDACARALKSGGARSVAVLALAAD